MAMSAKKLTADRNKGLNRRLRDRGRIRHWKDGRSGEGFRGFVYFAIFICDYNFVIAEMGRELI